MTEPSQPPKLKVYQGGRPSDMTSEELSAVIQKGMAKQRFPHLCVQFEDAALGKLAERISSLDVTSSDEEVKSAKRINKAALAMHLKGVFYEAAIRVTPKMGGLKASVMQKFEIFNYNCIDRVAGLLSDDLGPYRAAQMIPEPMRSELNAEISDRIGLKNLSSLIRKSLQLN